MNLFKGQISLDEIKYKLSYKEALMLRDVRVERLKREYDASEGGSALAEALDDELS